MKKRINVGKDNGMWKGNEVGYTALHGWIRKHKLKPEFCEECSKVPPYDLANISGEYKRDINDFRWLCRRCHMKNDGRLTKLHQNPWHKGKIISDFKIEVECRYCHKRFLRKKSSLNSKHTYCSKSCHYAYLKKYGVDEEIRKKISITVKKDWRKRKNAKMLSN